MPHPPEAVQAVVFDCDGLLLNTEKQWSKAESAVFERHGRPFGDEEKRALVGTSGETAALIFERLLDRPGEGAALQLEVRDRVIGEMAHARPMPGAVALLEALGGVPVAVASNSPRRILDAALRGAGVHARFGVTLAGDEVPEGKPSPDIYLEACRRLGVHPGHAVALEDSPTGAAAARAAGLFVVGIPSLEGVHLEADLLAESLADAAVWRALGVGAP